MRRKLLFLMALLVSSTMAWADDSGNCGDGVTYSYVESTHTLTISGMGAMADYETTNIPWESNKNDITSVVIENGVTSIGTLAFYQCDNLASVSIPASVTSIGQYAFTECGKSTTALTVTFATGSTLTTIGEGAFQQAKLTSITIPASVTSIGAEAFDQCEYLTTIDIPASVTSIGARAFHGCGNKVDAALTVTFASGSSLTTIGANAFGETKLSSISIPASVTSIGYYAFNCCTLTTVSIPASVTSIGECAFIGCEYLTTVTLNSNPSIGTGAFPSTTAVRMNLTKDPVGGANWMTFYNENYSFEADANTQVFKAALSGTTLTLTELTTDKIVNKDNAVILKSTANPIVMTLKTTDSNNDFTGNSLQGVKDPAGVTAANPSTIYVLNYKDEIGVGFYRLASTKKVGVGKAYLLYPDPETGGGNTREFFGFGDTTGINDVRGQKEDVRGEYYDLQGRRVSQPTKGLYIVNGKKVVIK